ncbi:DUF6682 family protein [Delftia lacustris]|uniref:phage adaptor protein n=1 Tax=Delftia lacustris TaxID=558537 RepID=UPI0006408E85|nr:DUF6682 family protein [Delftia lacustris]
MTLQDLIALFRSDAKDVEEPHLWDEPQVVGWFNEAQSEAAVRGRLLLDDSTPAVCEIAVAADIASYQLHPKVYEIAHLRFAGASTSEGRELAVVSREYLDRKDPYWRDRCSDEPRFAIQTETRLRLVPTPRESGALRLEAYRLPLKQLANCHDKPEIHEAHHAYLVHWALYRAFGQPDADGFDPGKSQQSYSVFESYFGMRPDSDLRRATRHDQPHTNVIHLP